MKRLFTIGAIVLFGHIAGMSSTWADDDGSSAAETPKGRSVSEFLTHDGRIDLEATRAAGFEGSLDLDGFDVRLDPATGEPLISPVAAAAAPDDEYWHDLSVPDPGMSSYVHVLTVYFNQLIVGGWFTTAGGTAANRIAAWDGSSWSPLGSGMNGSVRALTVYDNKLIAGGDFTTAGGTSANRIAAWDGSSWSPLGSGMSNWVRA
ncbi:MAG: hypothetical protein NTW07_07520, partial [candidate division Zixibacteria bacterium]|nr:hypothetical protein [candidate division Zixibacteria bacterium]